MSTTATEIFIDLQNKLHLPHPTHRRRNPNTGEMVPVPLCGQRSSRFFPAVRTAEWLYGVDPSWDGQAECQKCRAAAH